MYRETMLQKHIESILRAHDLFHPARKLLAACSGGTDSLALLDALEYLRTAGGAQVIAAHYEHGIRGAASRADARFVEAFCAARAIPFVCASGAVPAYARTHRLSLETAARVCRYDFLHRAAAEQEADAIVLAHHADDLAETVLLRILRGTGPAGLAAMRVFDGRHLRPLLSVTRETIEAYAAERGLVPRYDATNDDLDARRNRVRHELLPALRAQYNPAVGAALTRLSALAAEEDDLLTALAQEAFARARCPDGLSLEVLRALHPAMQRRVLRLFWAEETAAQDFSYLHEERLRDLLTAGGAARAQMQGGWYAYSRYGTLTLCRPSAQKEMAEKHEILLPFTREYAIMNFQGKEFHIRRLNRMTAVDWRRMEAGEAFYADCEALPPLVLRTRRTGDYMQLPAGRKKLKEILIDDKIPREERAALPLVALVDTSEVLWIAGGRRSVLAPVTESTHEILSIAYVKETIAG